MEAAIEAMRQQGAVIVDPVRLPAPSEYSGAMFEVMLYEFKANVNAYLASLGPRAPVKSLAELIAFNQAHADTIMPYFGQETFLQAEAKGVLTEQAYLNARATATRVARDKGIDKAIADNNLDAIVAPSGGPAWLTNLGAALPAHARAALNTWGKDRLLRLRRAAAARRWVGDRQARSPMASASGHPGYLIMTIVIKLI